MAAGRGELIIPGVTDLAEMQAVWAQTPGIRMGCHSYVPIEGLSAETRIVMEEAERVYAQEQQEAWGAVQRARALLDARLGPQAARLFESPYKLMRPSRLWPGVEYLIPAEGMVQVIRDGRAYTSLCVLAGRGEPWPDRIMTILDLLESGQERRLWEMANVQPKPQMVNVADQVQMQLIFILAIPILFVLGAILVRIFG